MNYEKNFWEKYEFLHERFKKQTNHISNFVDILKKFQNNCFEFNKNLTNILSKNYVFFEEQNSTQNEALKMLINNLKFFSEEIFKLGNFFKSNLIENLLFDNLIKEEKEKFNEIKKIYKNYNDIKILVEKNKKIFENSSKNAENNIITTLKLKLSDVIGKNDNLKKMENQTKEICESSKNHESKYIQSINDANKIKNNYVNLQIKYLNFFEIFDKNLGSKISNNLTEYIKYIKKLSNNILVNGNSLEDNFSKFSLEKDINNFINQNKCEYKCIEDIIFTPFQTSYDMKSNFNNQEINYQYIVTLKKYFTGVFPNFDLEEEKSKFELRKISAKVFKIGPNIFFTDEEKQILINFMKEEKFRKIFLIELSKQRTKGRYSRSKKLIQDLNDILNVILEVSEKENDYESGTNCIILSLTFYYEDKNKKIYLFEYIKDNKWLKSIEFWKKAIQSAVDKEIEKNKKINKKFEQNKSGVMNIIFGQLIPYTTNMKDFNIETGKIIEVIDEYVEAYNVTENLFKIIYDNICNEEELKQLREKGICGFKDKNYLEKIKNEEKEKEKKNDNINEKDMKKNNEENKDDKKIKEDDIKNDIINKENKKDEEKKEEEKNNETVENKNENKKEDEIKNNNQKDEENKNKNENKKEDENKNDNQKDEENKNENKKEEEIKSEHKKEDENKNDNQKEVETKSEHQKEEEINKNDNQEEKIKSENNNDNQEEEIKSETQKEEEINKNDNQKEEEKNENNKKNEEENTEQKEEENKNEN